MSRSTLETSAHVEAHLESVVDALTAHVRASEGNPTALAGARMTLAAYPAFFRGFDAEVRADGKPWDLIAATVALAANMFEHAITCCVETDGHAHMASMMLTKLHKDLEAALNGEVPDGGVVVRINDENRVC